MFSKRALEGYVEIDHRDSPGFSPQLAAKFGLAGLPVGPGQRFQAPAATCSHCQRLVIMNPQRTRDRAWCPKCDRYICDWCEAGRVASGGACRPFQQVVDNFINQAGRLTEV